VLFGDSVHEIQARRFLKGDIGASEFGLHAGDLSGTERTKTSQMLFGGIVEEAKRLNISEDDINKMIPLKRGVAFRDQSAFNQRRAVSAMDNVQDGFSEIFESYFEGYGTNLKLKVGANKDQADKVLAVLQERIKLVQAFNDSSKDTVFNFIDNAERLGLNFSPGQLSRTNYTSDMNNVLEDINNGTLVLSNDIDEDNTAEANRILNRLQGIYDPTLGQTNLRRSSGFDMQAYAQMTLAKLGYDSDYNKMSNPAMAGLASSVDVSKFITSYKDAMADGEMDHTETKQLIATLEELSRKIDTKDNDSQLLIAEIEKLIKAQDDLTNELRADNAS